MIAHSAGKILAIIPPTNRLKYFLPIALFLAIAAAFGVGLTMDPKTLPSALIGKTVPKFDLPPVKGRTLGLSDKHLHGEVTLVNFFASWCLACRKEHPFLMELSKNAAFKLHGVNYKDKPSAVETWLNETGDPFARTGVDDKGRIAIDWGVFGIPETFVVGPDGRIAYKHIGGLNLKAFADKLLPVIRRLNAQGS
jgi:cytochrome c biogenesis protein CcmG/thiol:disulfide interchange protein DsbE